MAGPLATVLVLVTSACTGLPELPREPAPQGLAATIARGLADQLALGPQIGADYSGLRAVLVEVDGEPVLERYFDCSGGDAHDLDAVTTSVLSTLVGVAVGEGRLRLDDPLAELLPAYRSAMTRPTSRATLRQVLTMTAGFPARFRGRVPAFTFSRDWVRDILASADAPPGERFVYSDGSAHLVSAILEQATGTPVLEYARSRLFGPLGIPTTNADDGFGWPVDPQGHATGHRRLRLRPADLAKIGRLYLDDGRWEGEQLLPAAWVHAATVNQSEVPVWAANGVAYGYQWWIRSARDRDAYAALGSGGQLLEVVPSLRLVVVTAGEVDPTDATDHGVAVSLMTSFVESVAAPAVQDAS